MTHTLLHRDDPSIENFRGVFFKIRKALGTTAFGLNEVVLPPGMAGNEHDEVETGHEEVYIVLDGTGRFVIDGAEVDVAAGDYLHIAPVATRQVTAGPEGLRFVAVGGQARPEHDGRPSL
jgi:uncharacterized cupin superfamily protein